MFCNSFLNIFLFFIFMLLQLFYVPLLLLSLFFLFPSPSSPIPFPPPPPPPPSRPFNISYNTGFLVTNSFSFFLSDKIVISPSILNESLAG